ncbi:hypothetical protein BGZ73_007407, partial [Actinomortierella ambigua]
MAIAATAQQVPIAPKPVQGAGYVKYKNKFYIYGGDTSLAADSTSDLGQFFALDLSKSWKSESPAWIPLPEGPIKSHIGAAMSLDGKIFMTFPGIGYAAHRFSFETNTWSLSNATFRESIYDVSPVTLGTDGTVLIAGGSPNSIHVYDIYSFATDQTVTAQLPATVVAGTPILPGTREYSVAWSEPLKSAVFFGGFGEDVSSIGVVTFYNAEKKAWSVIKTTGANNTMVLEHCVAI